jgi:flavin-dependent dehydrogenase
VTDVLVLGAGPAGCAAALGLTRLGVARVRIISRPRTDAIEGISRRTINLLRTSGLVNAACECAAVSPRIAYWAGQRIAANRESLVSRARFDAALGRDIATVGLEITTATVREVLPEAGGFRVATDAGDWHAHCVIDARGRRVRRPGELGPRLIAWSELRRPLRAAPRGSVLVALEGGWCWVASTGEHADSRLQLQYVSRPHGAARLSSAALLAAAAEHMPELAPALTATELLATGTGCAAVARFSLPAPTPGLVRVGDSAVAMDPLSGHGVFEALRSSQVAIAAVNSYLTGVDWELIARFLNAHAGELWRRALATAAEFYRREAEHAANPFWLATADAYATRAALAGPRYSGPGRIESRPVLNGSRIELREVWVSTNSPRGIWQVSGRTWRVSSGDGAAR